MVTFHPVTLEKGSAVAQMSELLSALDELESTSILFTLPNADAEGRVLFDLITKFVECHPKTKAFTSLGYQRYLSCLQVVDGVVGNSSSGIVEAPTFKKGTINIGDRQRGRERAASVIDCPPLKKDIKQGIMKLYSQEFQESLNNVVNPHGTGGASNAIVQVLEEVSLEKILKKKFFNLEVL